MRKILTAMALIALAGCATTPTPVKTAVQVSSDSIYGFQEKTSEDAGKVTVIRDGGFTGSGCDLIFYIEGKRAAKIATGQKASFYVQPGDINLGSGPIFSAACGSAAIRTISAKVRPNQESLFRLSGDMQGFYLAPYIDYGGK
jgi:hypothetical protein